MSAAILQGAPATTLDTDIWIDLPERQYLRVLEIAKKIGATALAPTAVALPDDSMVNFLYRVDGLSSFGTEFRKARRVELFGAPALAGRDVAAIENRESKTKDVSAGIVANGFAVARGVVGPEEIGAVVAAVEASAGQLAGVRQPHVSFPQIRELVASPAIRDLVEPILGANARVVRSVFFDKTPEKNWGVPWHQDLTIAVVERREVTGFIGWSVKEGVHHVQAPREILEQMLTVRLHLDDCASKNGPLRVLPGTHRNGWLDSEAIEKFKREVPEHVCIAPRGGAVLMRPLLLHASSRATKPGHRRVLHLEFAADDLPGGLRFCPR